MVLGLSSKEMVARVSRLRIADDTPLAIERAALSSAVLPEPEAVGASLYAALEQTGNRPVRAMQRISAANLGEADARLLGVAAWRRQPQHRTHLLSRDRQGDRVHPFGLSRRHL